MGEEVAQFHGAYKVTEGLLDRFGPKRIVDTPISEAGFIGLGIGASMLGLRPVIELMFWSFYSVAFDQILNNAANIRYMSGGQINCPIVIRGPANGGTNVGATHSHTPENILANHPGREGRRAPPRPTTPRASSSPPSATTTRSCSWRTRFSTATRARSRTRSTSFRSAGPT